MSCLSFDSCSTITNHNNFTLPFQLSIASRLNLTKCLMHHVFPEGGGLKAPPRSLPTTDCPAENCSCFEDNTAYFGNNIRIGNDNPQPTRLACQQSCDNHPSCTHWTWGKSTPTGPCYLKTKRDNVGHNLDSYVSGGKFCKLPEAVEGSQYVNLKLFCPVTTHKHLY